MSNPQDELFFRFLTDKNNDLLQMAAKKKYTFMVPLPKCIPANMLIRNFYDNHTFYQCDYDENMHINLNGRVLEVKNNQFQTYAARISQLCHYSDR